MSDEKIIDAEIVEEKVEGEKTETTETKKEEKKPGFFTKMKNKVNQTFIDSGVEQTYNEGKDEFYFYKYGGNVFDSKLVRGEVNKETNTLTYFGELTIEKYGLVVNNKTQEAYYALNYDEDVEITINYEGNEYKRKLKVLHLDPKVEEVKVIKAENKFYLYKGEK